MTNAVLQEAESLSSLASKSLAAAFKGGFAGFVAGVVQVLVFMWLRTITNRQYYTGGSTSATARELWKQGGVMRFYHGLQYAIIENPMCKFGDTFANTGILALLVDVPMHPVLKTVFVSIVAASWRILITPINTLKTMLQVHGASASKPLWVKVHQHGIAILWAGALGNFAAALAGNYPWWATFNTISVMWAKPADGAAQIVRHGVIGMCSSLVSDAVSNVFRVLKTGRQANPDANIGYHKVASHILKTDGITGLFLRGLSTRMITNILQVSCFTILWKILETQL